MDGHASVDVEVLGGDKRGGIASEKDDRPLRVVVVIDGYLGPGPAQSDGHGFAETGATTGDKSHSPNQRKGMSRGVERFLARSRMRILSEVA